MKHRKPVSMFLAAVALCLVLGLVFPGGDPARAAKGGNKGGDTSDNEKWPSTITFLERATDHFTSDGDVAYGDNTPNPGDVEAFIGSEAKDGDIILNLRPISADTARHITLDFGATPNFETCGAPPALDEQNPDHGGATNHLNVQHLEVNVSDDGVIDGQKLSQGVYNMVEDDEVLVSMRLLVRDANDELWFVNYGSGERKLCGAELGTGNYPVLVEHLGTPDGDGIPAWRVTSTGVACLEKHGGAGAKTKKCGSHHLDFQFDIQPLEARP